MATKRRYSYTTTYFLPCQSLHCRFHHWCLETRMAALKKRKDSANRTFNRLFTHMPKCTPPWVFSPLDLPFQYWIDQVTFGLLHVMFRFSARIFYRVVPGFATDCPCDVWCRGWTTCLLYAGPFWQVWNDSGFESWSTTFLTVLTMIYIYLNSSQYTKIPFTVFSCLE